MRRESAPWPCSKPVAAETQVIHWVRGETAIGPIVLAATARGICHLSIAADTARLIKAFPRCERLEAGPWAGQFLDRVVDAIAQPHLPHDLPLDPQGTEFQHKVWAEVCRIPGGETRSYSSIAATIGRPKAIRARPMGPTRLPFSFPATALCEAMARWRAMPMALTVRRGCWTRSVKRDEDEEPLT